MLKQFYARSWKELVQRGGKDRLALWTQEQALQHDETDEELIEQNQYLWAEYLGDIGLGQ